MKRLMLALFVAVAACGSAALPVRSVAVDLHEFAVVPDASLLAAGEIELTMANSGRFPHTVVVTDSAGLVIAATDVIAPGGEASLAVNLSPGDYSLTCRIVGTRDDGAVIDHYEAGMEAPIEVAG